MELFYIVIPFFSVSLISGFFAEKFNSSKAYNYLLLAIITIACLIGYLINKGQILEYPLLMLSVFIFFLGSLTRHKALEKLCNYLGWGALLPMLYFADLTAQQSLIILTFSSFILYSLEKHLTDKTLVMSQLIPLTIIAMYIPGGSALFIILMSTIFSSLRFFTVHLKKELPPFFLQSYCAIFLAMLASSNIENLSSNMLIYLSGITFLVLNFVLSFILRKKKSLIQRIYDQSELVKLAAVRTSFLNIFALATMVISLKLDLISPVVALTLILIGIAIYYAKLWYKENETF